MRLKQIGPNQTELHLDNGDVVFFSYETPVAAFATGRGYVRSVEQYSRTTTRHINQWLNSQGQSPTSTSAVPQARLDALITVPQARRDALISS